jgi:hypothetical protein
MCKSVECIRIGVWNTSMNLNEGYTAAKTSVSCLCTYISIVYSMLNVRV